MAEGTPIDAAQLFSDDASAFFIDAGVPRYNRRLTDKILAAFNHAYAMGEMEIARALWECLVAAEKLGQQPQRRHPNQAVGLAAEWVAFVDARDRYREVSRARPADPGEAADAFRTMRDAYRSWIAQNAGEAPQPRPAAPAAVGGGANVAPAEGVPMPAAPLHPPAPRAPDARDADERR